jgi:hypothetical protein
MLDGRAWRTGADRPRRGATMLTGVMAAGEQSRIGRGARGNRRWTLAGEEGLEHAAWPRSSRKRDALETLSSARPGSTSPTNRCYAEFGYSALRTTAAAHGRGSAGRCRYFTPSLSVKARPRQLAGRLPQARSGQPHFAADLTHVASFAETDSVAAPGGPWLTAAFFKLE